MRGDGKLHFSPLIRMLRSSLSFVGRADAADSKAVKTTRRKKVARVKAPIENRCAASATDLQERLDLRSREFREALEQQAATAWS